jgi:hypothetical protein
MGFEIKVHRSDWLQELKQPQKSDPVQKYCRHWWVATPPGIVASGELPPTWGHVVVTGGKAKVVVNAPALDEDNLTWEFGCALMRRASESQVALEMAAVAKATKLFREEYNAEAFEKMRLDLNRSQAHVARLQQDEQRTVERLKTLQEGLVALGIDADWKGAISPGTREAMALSKLLLGHEFANANAIGIGLKSVLRAYEDLESALQSGTKR